MKLSPQERSIYETRTIMSVSSGVLASLLIFPALAQSRLDVPVMAGGHEIAGVCTMTGVDRETSSAKSIVCTTGNKL